MSTMSVDIEYGAVCDVHGDDLEVDMDQDRNGVVTLRVKPCQRCLSDQHDLSYNDGFQEAERVNGL